MLRGWREGGNTAEQPWLHLSCSAEDNFSLPGVPQTRGAHRLYIIQSFALQN